MALDWTWDEGKAEVNVQKHGVSFRLAARALDDPLRRTSPDLHPDADRWRTLCNIAGRVLFIVHTLPNGEPGRIISARKATPRERRDYEG